MAYFLSVPNNPDFSSLERKVLEEWRREKTFEVSVKAREGRPSFIFYDGPPFATGLPHYGHILTTYIKDIVPRYYTMRGFHVPRRWGWDCHGLPVEFEVEKDQGFRSRTDILDFGIDQFNQSCRSMVLKYADEWQRIVTRLGRWVDFDGAYRTMDSDYIESVLWAFKELWRHGLIYEGLKVVAYCTRCQTPLSNFEARQDDAFRQRVDSAISVRFRQADDRSRSFLAWTTTPWTLPSNIALAVGADIEYVRLSNGSESVWLARSAMHRFALELKEYREVEIAYGRSLQGLKYDPVFPYFASLENGFRVLLGDFVSTEDGTGIVHLAPAFGEEDAVVCAQNGIEGPNPVRDDGTFDSRVSDFYNRHVLESNSEIISALRTRGLLFRTEQYAHNYPHCWRCDSPLIYRSIKTWFVKVTEIKQGLLIANNQIRWVPEHVGVGRFGNWLENARDWAVSRNRFWGAPVPVWRCSKCQKDEVIGNRSELAEKSGVVVEDWHRPYIDQITLVCACGGVMTRVPDVLDCWFESGAMPFAQVHYPFEQKAEFEAAFPGDFIVEYIAQTRGWFYTLVVISTALFNCPPFRNALCHGVILAGDGRKMSKRLKNYPDPMQLVDAHGSDALRIALMQSVAVRGADTRFSGDAVRESVRRLCIPLWNCIHYFTAYAEIDEFEPKGRMLALTRLDRYLLSETHRLCEAIEANMGSYDIAGCYDAIENYVTMLSTWYVRLSKRRFWKAGISVDKITAFEVLYAALSTLSILIAPFLPFLSESVHRALGGKRSVHLEDWPSGHTEWSNEALSSEMESVRLAVRLVRSVREEHRISHRQPLRSVAIAGISREVMLDNRDILLEELNVKEIYLLDSIETYVRPIVKPNYPRLGKRLRGDIEKIRRALDKGEYVLSCDFSKLEVAGYTLDHEDFMVKYVASNESAGVAARDKLIVVIDLAIDAELLAERYVRDLNRGLQDLRKEAGLRYQDRIMVGISAPMPVLNAVSTHSAWLSSETLAEEIMLECLISPEAKKEIELGDNLQAEIMLRKISS